MSLQQNRLAAWNYMRKNQDKIENIINQGPITEVEVNLMYKICHLVLFELKYAEFKEKAS